METKLTVRVPRHLLEKAKYYAGHHHTNLTNLITEFLANIPEEDRPSGNTPLVNQLSGIMSQKTTIDEYKKHLFTIQGF